MSSQRVIPRKVKSSWKPILAFAKGKPNAGWVIDLITGGGRKKDLHLWEQPTNDAEYLIEKLTQPGNLLCDPFTGSGTTLGAAKKLDGNYIGCEVAYSQYTGRPRRW